MRALMPAVSNKNAKECRTPSSSSITCTAMSPNADPPEQRLITAGSPGRCGPIPMSCLLAQLSRGLQASRAVRDHAHPLAAAYVTSLTGCAQSMPEC